MYIVVGAGKRKNSRLCVENRSVSSVALFLARHFHTQYQSTAIGQ